MTTLNTWLPGNKFYDYNDGVSNQLGYLQDPSGGNHLCESFIIPNSNAGFGITFDMVNPAFGITKPPKVSYASTSEMLFVLKDSEGWLWSAPCPVPRRVDSSVPSFHHRDEVLLQRRAAGGVRQHPARRAVEDVLRGKADPLQARDEHRVGRQGTAGRVQLRLGRQSHRLGEDQLLVGERCVDLGDVHRGHLVAGGRPGTCEGRR